MSRRRKQRRGKAAGPAFQGKRQAPYPLRVLVSVVQRTNRATIVRGILACAFFGLFYVYIREYLDPRLLYHANEVVLPSGESIYFPVYLQGAAFFKEFLNRPGGLSEYLGARYSQYYYYPYLGPLVLTAIAGLVFLAGDWLIRLTGGTGDRPLRFVPPLLLLMTYNQYTFRLENYVALVAALMAAALYLLVANRVDRLPVRLLLFAALSPAVYYAAGALYILFAVLCAVHELVTRRRYVLGGLYVLVGAGIPLLAGYLLDMTFAAACFRPAGIYAFEKAVPGLYAAETAPPADRASEASWSGAYPSLGRIKTTVLSAVYLFFAFLPVVLLFRRLLARWTFAVSSRSGRLGKYCLSQRLKPVYAVLALIILSASVALYTLDEDARTVLRANYFARMEMWPEFLEEVDRYPLREYPASLMVDVNRALFETGQMGSRMFSYPQNPRVLFQLGKHAASLKGGCEVLFQLGRINEAEHAALEALEMNGERPEILRLLADIYIVKRQPEVARVFLKVLSKDLAHGPWAEDRLRRLDDDPLLSLDPQIRDLRSFMPRTDMVTESKELVLLALLANNRKNRMAFEYLMAYYLLTRQPGKIACHLDRLDDFRPHGVDHPVIPEHYAEAVLLYFHNVNRPLETPPHLRGWRIGEQTRERVREVIQIARDCQNDKKAIGEILGARFPNSVSRYLLTGKSGGAE